MTGGDLWVKVTLSPVFRNMLDLDEKKHLTVKRKHGMALCGCLETLFMWVDYPHNLNSPPQLLQLGTVEARVVKCSVLMKIRLKSLPKNAKKTDLENTVLLHNLRPDFIKKVRVVRIVI